jgi:hypothetical protein
MKMMMRLWVSLMLDPVSTVLFDYAFWVGQVLEFA